MRNIKTLKLVQSALLAALCLLLTRVVTIPAPTGYVNLGDCAVLLSAWMPGPIWGGMAAGIGTMLADVLSGYASYAPATFLVKFAMAVIAETGAGQHGVALATAAAYFGLECDIYMGAVDIKKQAPNVARMKILGARVVEVTDGLQTLKEAVDAAFAAYCNEYKDAIYCIGSVVGPHPFPMMVRDFQSVVGIEAREQFLDMTGELPDAVVACVGGGSNAMGLFSGFLNDPVDIYGVEPLGRGIKMGDHAASLTYGEEGIMHGFNSIMLKDENGDPAPVYSVASGLDYPSCGPEHAFLHDLGRVKYDVVTDDETIDAFFELSRMEGIIPAIESSHAVAYGMKLAKTMGKGSVLINLSGRGDKDMDYIIEKYGIR